MKRNYILCQVILIVVELTFCSCNVEKNHFQLSRHIPNSNFRKNLKVCKYNQLFRSHVFGGLPNITTRLSLPVLSMRMQNIFVY